MNFFSTIGSKLKDFFSNKVIEVDNTTKKRASVSAYDPFDPYQTRPNGRGVMASGKKAYDGAIATNDRSLSFGTKVRLGGKSYTVEDRMNPRFNYGQGTDPLASERMFDIATFDGSAKKFGRQSLDYEIEASKVVPEKPFNMLGETLKEFFNPVTFAQTAGKFGKEVAQSIPRSVLTVGLSSPAGKLLGEDREIRPREDFGDVGAKLLGERPIRPFRETGSDFLKDLGFSDEQAKKLGLPIGIGLTTLDLFPSLRGGKSLKVLAESTDLKFILKFLKDESGLADDVLKPVAEQISKATDETTVKSILDDLAENASKERKFITTVKESPATAPEVAADIKGRYVPITNKNTLDEANKLIQTNLDEAMRIVKSAEAATAKSNAIAQSLIIKFQNEGSYQQAIDIVETTAKKATSQGQAIQALSLYNKLTPEGVLRYTQTLIDRANLDKFKTAGAVERAMNRGKAIKLTPDIAKDIIDQSKKARELPEGSQEKIVETANLVKKITDQIPATLLQKISFLQTVAQLLNPKTAVRNIIGNLGFAGIENVKDVVAAAIDSPLSLITGQRTKVLPSLKTQVKGGLEGLAEGVKDAMKGINTNFIPSQFDLPKTGVFKGKVGGSLEKFLNLELRAPDRAFYKAAYDGSLYQQMKAAKVTEATDAMKEVAHYDALYRTFQDDSVVARMFVGLKRALNLKKEFGVGDILIKYPKTPGNLLARGIEYSPVGFVNSVLEMAKPLAGREFNQKAFVESLSRAITGTGTLIGTGALLHKLGIITGKKDPDVDVRGIQRTTGLGQYKINVSGLKRFVFGGFNAELAKLQEGDKLISYDWFQPQAIGLSIGANIDDGEGVTGSVAQSIQAISEGINTLAEQPLISGLTKVTKASSFSDIIGNVLEGVPSSFVPTVLSQINQLIDNTQRNSYDPSSLNYAKNMAKAKIPGLAQTLPPSVSVLGEDLERYQGESNNLFNVFFNPAFISSFKPTPAAQMVLDIMSETGEKTQFPRSVSFTQTINGQRIKISPTQLNALQHYVGTITKELFDSFANDPNFQELPVSEKVNYLQNILTDIGTAGRIVVLGSRPSKISKRVQDILRRYNQ